MKKFLNIIALLISFSLISQTGKVINVKDGDTIVILDSINVQHTIRVADIDCPERGQPFSAKAKKFVSAEIYGETIFVQKKSVDKYGRTIGYVLYENKNLSLELLKMGLAWHYSYYSDSKEMEKLEAEAKKNKIGLWIDSNPINPYKWRKNKKTFRR